MNFQEETHVSIVVQSKLYQQLKINITSCKQGPGQEGTSYKQSPGQFRYMN